MPAGRYGNFEYTGSLIHEMDNRDAILQLYQTHYHALFAAGCYLTDDKELIRDCIHQLFLHCWQKKDELSKILHLKNYLTVSLRNRLLTALKQQNKTVTYEPGEMDGVEYSYEEILIRQADETDKQQNLQRALHSLPPRYKQVIEMRFFRQYSYEEIARITGQPVKTAYNYVHEALAALRKQLKGKPSLPY
ncbi:sigma-70 family RNA polymerase sigma factor [Chitinophaga sp. CC14]|uniref:RNA polymerase sigma factor n=1 Tax=Chitinophaga sp. CC14 TaxID=3029199 RepID=UPI003B7E530E